MCRIWRQSSQVLTETICLKHAVHACCSVVNVRVSASQDSIFDYPWNNFLHSSVEQAIYTVLTPESSMFSVQNLHRTANLTSRKQLNITDLEADAEFDFDTRPSGRGGGGGAGGTLSTSRESGRGAGRDELENFLGDSLTEPKSSPPPAAPAADGGATTANSESEQTAPANDLAHSNSDAPPVQSAAEAHARVVSHVCLHSCTPMRHTCCHDRCECL